MITLECLPCQGRTEITQTTVLFLTLIYHFYVPRPFARINAIALQKVETGNLSLSWPIMLNPVSWDGE
jgi:hypothetical protein